jgi:galactokinase/mevalonate kinase-like predicted kinase
VDTVIIATAPGRCGIVGNPTDMYGGCVISVSTVERARCVLEPCEGIRITSSGESCEIHGPEDLEIRGDRIDLARAALAYFRIRPQCAGYHLQLTTEVPMQSGMAGSTALVVAVVGALNRWHGFCLHPWAIAETARKIEFGQLGVLCGLQDQHMSAFGGLNFMHFGGKELLEQRDDEPLAIVEPLGPYVLDVPLVAVHTGVPHDSGSVHRTPRDRWLAGEECVIHAYERIADLARQAKRCLLTGDWPKLGLLMDENHSIVSELGGSGPANDRLIEAAREAGAYGAKLAGAGGGGTVLALAADPERVGRAMMEAGGDLMVRPRPSPGLTVTVR